MFPKSEDGIKQERKAARRKYDRKINTKQCQLQDKEVDLKAKVKTILRSGQKQKAKLCALELQRVRQELVLIEKQKNQMAIIDSRSEKHALSGDVNDIIKLDIEQMNIHTKKHDSMAMHADLQEYEAMQTKHKALSELLEDAMESTLEEEEEEEECADSILEQMEMEIALESQTLVASIPMSASSTRSELKAQEQEQEECGLDPLMVRFENLKRDT